MYFRILPVILASNLEPDYIFTHSYFILSLRTHHRWKQSQAGEKTRKQKTNLWRQKIEHIAWQHMPSYKKV